MYNWWSLDRSIDTCRSTIHFQFGHLDFRSIRNTIQRSHLAHRSFSIDLFNACTKWTPFGCEQSLHRSVQYPSPTRNIPLLCHSLKRIDLAGEKVNMKFPRWASSGQQQPETGKFVNLSDRCAGRIVDWWVGSHFGFWPSSRFDTRQIPRQSFW